MFIFLILYNQSLCVIGVTGGNKKRQDRDIYKRSDWRKLKIIGQGKTSVVVADHKRAYKIICRPASHPNFQREIIFGTFAAKLSDDIKHKNCFLPLIDYWEENKQNIPKNIHLPEKEGSDTIVVLVYDRLLYPFSSVYRQVDTKEKYRMCIDFIKSIEIMGGSGLILYDIKLDNIMKGQDKWYMIDYGILREFKEQSFAWAVIDVFNCLCSKFVLFRGCKHGTLLVIPQVLGKHPSEVEPELFSSCSNMVKQFSSNKNLFEFAAYILMWHVGFEKMMSNEHVLRHFKKIGRIPYENAKDNSIPGISSEDIIHCISKLPDFNYVISYLQKKHDMIQSDSRL